MSRRIDSARIRAQGANVAALVNSHLRIQEELNAAYEALGDELQRADPTSPEGKELEALFLDVMHVHSRFSTSYKFTEICERMTRFGLGQNQQQRVPLAAGMAAAGVS